MSGKSLEWYWGRLDTLKELQEYRYLPTVLFWDTLGSITKRTEEEVDEMADEEAEYYGIGGTD